MANAWQNYWKALMGFPMAGASTMPMYGKMPGSNTRSQSLSMGSPQSQGANMQRQSYPGLMAPPPLPTAKSYSPAPTQAATQAPSTDFSYRLAMAPTQAPRGTFTGDPLRNDFVGNIPNWTSPYMSNPTYPGGAPIRGTADPTRPSGPSGNSRIISGGVVYPWGWDPNHPENASPEMKARVEELAANSPAVQQIKGAIGDEAYAKYHADMMGINDQGYQAAIEKIKQDANADIEANWYQDTDGKWRNRQDPTQWSLTKPEYSGYKPGYLKFLFDQAGVTSLPG